MSSSRIFVTTTPTLQGWEIENYLGPVFSHIVAGTGFFSDFAAGFSDIFGGRSQTYQKQLSAINDEAIELLKSKASLLGGNLILGLRIDHDEISGKSIQMFMITASGTAARGVRGSSSKGSQQSSSFLTSDALDTAIKKKAIIDKCKAIPISLTEEEWDFVTENQLHEIAPQVLASLQQTLKQQINLPPDERAQGNIDRRRRYFLSLSPEYSIPPLYVSLERNDLLFPFVRDTIVQGDLFDFDALANLYKSQQFNLQKWALALTRSSKPFYTPDDIGKFSELIETIKSTFGVRAKFIEEKSKFSSSVKQKWQCECGTKNNKDQPRCSSCLKDAYGFGEDEPNPNTVINSIQTKLTVLQTAFALTQSKLI